MISSRPATPDQTEVPGSTSLRTSEVPIGSGGAVRPSPKNHPTSPGSPFCISAHSLDCCPFDRRGKGVRDAVQGR